jgi:hypothetical protein
MSRFQKGVHYPHPSRGLGRKPYNLSRKAHAQRVRALASWRRPRTYEQSRRIEIEICLGAMRGEGYRGMTRRLGLRNHEYCRRVARRYKAGAIPLLRPDEAGLLAILGEIDGSFVAPTAKKLDPFPVEPAGYSGHCLRCPSADLRQVSVMRGLRATLAADLSQRRKWA